jgi:crotonobetainyl-CoA:carnitine CoA-transferase CaiB-like acyl-CoA transferase
MTMTNEGPLAGLKIIDISSVMMGPYATQILGDLGADVIKIEAASGDTTRQIPPMRNANMGCVFLHANRNKRSLVLNLKDPDAYQAMLAILSTADALVSNIRPRAMARLGLNYEKLAEINPRLIVINFVGFGQRGPYAANPAYEDLIQGLTAVPNMLVDAGSEKPHYVPLSFNDRSVGLQGAIALLAAVVRRASSGRGQQIEVPMFETMVQSMYGDHMGGLSYVPAAGPAGYKRQLNKQRRPFATLDGYVCTIIYTDAHWQRFADLIGKPQLMQEDARFKNITQRSEHAEAVYSLIADEMTKKTTGQWMALLKEADIPIAPLHTLESVLDDPHLNATGFFQVTQHPTEGAIREMNIPTEWSESKPSIRRHAPQLGEHSVEVLHEAGLTQDAIDKLLASGAARQAQ